MEASTVWEWDSPLESQPSEAYFSVSHSSNQIVDCDRLHFEVIPKLLWNNKVTETKEYSFKLKAFSQILNANLTILSKKTIEMLYDF